MGEWSNPLASRVRKGVMCPKGRAWLFLRPNHERRSKMKGYAGQLLFVDLTTGAITKEALPEEWTRKYVGGYGIGAKVLYDRMPAGADPLGPDNIFGIVTGPTTGTRSFFSGRYAVVCKSPVTGGWNDANSGGYIGPELKKAGFDGVFISGISEKPVYLWIHEGEAEIREASHLAGIDCKEIIPILKDEVEQPKARVMAIGKPGEQESLISCPINDGHRAPARGGLGAVMGSKKLKAVVVYGTGKIEVDDEDRITELNKGIVEVVKTGDMALAFGEYGTGAMTAASALIGDSPVKNWQGVGISDYGEESAERFSAMNLDRYKKKKYNCANCPLGCGATYEVNDGPWPMKETERPEYETAAAFGSTILNGNEHAMLKCNEI